MPVRQANAEVGPIRGVALQAVAPEDGGVKSRVPDELAQIKPDSFR